MWKPKRGRRWPLAPTSVPTSLLTTHRGSRAARLAQRLPTSLTLLAGGVCRCAGHFTDLQSGALVRLHQCIPCRRRTRTPPRQNHPRRTPGCRGARVRTAARLTEARPTEAVSYTHLTLPTIYSV